MEVKKVIYYSHVGIGMIPARLIGNIVLESYE